jgi:hypothetical protein
MGVGGETVPPIDPERLEQIRALVDGAVLDPTCGIRPSLDFDAAACGEPARCYAAYSPCGHGIYLCAHHAEAMIEALEGSAPVCVTHPVPLPISSITWTSF